MLKWWSPMSLGAWAIAVFSACSFLSFLGAIWPDGRLDHILTRGWFARVFQVVGCTIGFFVASYTGVLLEATNQPVWSESEWIGPLFLTSAASTSIAALLLLGRNRRNVPAESLTRLEHADLWALASETFLFLIFLASLGVALPLALQTPAAIIMVAGTLVLALLVPLVLHVGLGETASWRIPAAALSSLVGGFLLRFGVIRTPAELLATYDGHPPEIPAVPLWQTWQGVALLAVTVILAVAVPLAIRRVWRLSAGQTALVGVLSAATLRPVSSVSDA